MEQETKFQKRKVAVKILINDLITGTYIKRPGWEPSGVLTRYGEITRINLIGLIVSKETSENGATYMIDDGTGNITIRLFEQPLNEVELGDIFRIIGRVRENNNEIFIVPEIMKKTSKEWHKIHRIELSTNTLKKVNLPVEPPKMEDGEVGPHQKILNAIAILDKGDGADVQDIINHVKIDESEIIINGLISEGEVFEISPGVIKVLE
jgi:RPA family protein